MRCKNCDYALWNIRTRQCPECGSPFKPSDFEFVVDSVKFCCPHCEQAYFGTGEKGHLVPPIFDCVACGKRVHMDEMALLPAEGLSEQQTKMARMPWLERQERGIVKAWFAMLKWAMVQPNRLIRAIPENSSVAGAWLYAFITTAMFFCIGMFIPQLLWLFTQSRIGGFAWGSMGFNLASYAVTLFVIGVVIAGWPLSTHLILKMTGGKIKPLSRTCHAIFYSAGANVLSAIPCCGWLGGITWWSVSATNMIKDAHGVHGGRAAIAVILWPILSCIVLVVGWYLLAMFFFMAGMAAMGPGMGGTGGSAWTPQNMPVMNLNNNLIQYSMQNGGQGPEHAIELVLQGTLNTWMFGAGGGPGNPVVSAFCYAGTNTTPGDIPVATGNLQSYPTLPKGKQLDAVSQVLNNLPPNVIAHRFGDFIFTHHGANMNTYDSQRWNLVMLPDPAVNPAPQPTDPVIIGLGDYTVTQTTFAQIPGLLQTQNQHRATLGLPPLPDLTTITHAQPAIAQSTGDSAADPAADDAGVPD